MKRTIKSFKEYCENWMMMASTTHPQWWINQINSGKTTNTFIKNLWNKYCKRYK